MEPVFVGDSITCRVSDIHHIERQADSDKWMCVFVNMCNTHTPPAEISKDDATKLSELLKSSTTRKLKSDKTKAKAD